MFWWEWGDVMTLLVLAAAIVTITGAYAAIVLRAVVRLILVERVMRSRMAALQRRPHMSANAADR
jgi:hypothetical protein